MIMIILIIGLGVRCIMDVFWSLQEQVLSFNSCLVCQQVTWNLFACCLSHISVFYLTVCIEALCSKWPCYCVLLLLLLSNESYKKLQGFVTVLLCVLMFVWLDSADKLQSKGFNSETQDSHF